MRTLPITFTRAGLPLVAALLTSSLAACSGGGSTPLTPSLMTSANASQPVLSNETVIASPPGDPQLVDYTAPKTLARQSLSTPGTDVTLFHDDFNLGVATGWTVKNGGWSVVTPSGRTAEYAANKSSNTVFAGSDAWTDYGVEASLRPENIAGTRRGTVLIARAVDSNHYYQFEFANEQNGNRWELWRNDGGSYVSLGSGTYPYVADRQYLVQLKMFGSNISIAIADNYDRQFVDIASVTDTKYSHGRIGLRVWGGATSTFDNVRAWTTAALASPTPGSSAGASPSPAASSVPSVAPSMQPTAKPTAAPTAQPTAKPTAIPAATPPPGSSAFIPPAGTQLFPGLFDNTISNPQVLANSSTMIGRALNGSNDLGQIHISTHPLSQGLTDGQTTVYTAHNSDPHYRIHCMMYSNCPLEGADVAIPVGAIPGGNLGVSTFTDNGRSDQHMAVRNVDTQIETDMWLTPTPSGQGGTLNIGYGGAFPFSSGGYGHGGATAAGFALSQGRIRPADLMAGHIPYALVLSTPCEDGHVFPASGDDGEHISGCPPIGSRVWLDSSNADIANSGADPYWQVVMNALHEYGGYIEDHCGCNLGVAAEGGVAYQAFGLSNPWTSIIASHFPSARSGGSENAYQLRIDVGNINLGQHLHIIQ